MDPSHEDEAADPSQADPADPSHRMVRSLLCWAKHPRNPFLILIKDLRTSNPLRLAVGGLGKCYMACNKADKKEKAKAELQLCLREVEQHVREHDLITPSMMDSYLAYCRGTLQSCLLSAFCTLLGESHILSCVHQQKADQDL